MKIFLSRKYDNYILFFSLVGVLFLLPFVNAMPMLRFALVGQYTFVMLYLVFSARHTRALYLVDMAFVVPTLIATWLDSVYQNDYTFVASYLSMMIFFLYLQYLVIRQMIHAHKVDTNTIFGAMNIYLVAGLIWAYAFILLNHFDSSAFHLASYENISKEVELFTYYSYSTLTTLGYGDIVPESAQARMLSVLEAVFGQLYLAIVIAKLVSISWREERNAKEESIMSEMGAVFDEKEYDLVALRMTNPLKQGEVVFFKGHKRIIEKAFDVVVQNGKCHIPQTLSRKKDFMPKIGYFCTTS